MDLVADHREQKDDISILYMQPSPDDKPLPVNDLSEAEKLLEKYESDYRQWTIKARSLFLGYVDADNVEKIFEKCKVKKCGDTTIFPAVSLRRQGIFVYGNMG